MGSPRTSRGPSADAGVRNDRSIGTVKSPIRSPIFRLLSCPSSMKRWTSFKGVMTFRNSTENIMTSPGPPRPWMNR